MQDFAEQIALDRHGRSSRSRVGIAAGFINGIVIAYGKVVAFMATLAMLVAARGLAEILAERRTLAIERAGLHRASNADILGVDILIWIFVIVAVLGWLLLNRTTFGRRTVAIGGNREAARLAGIKVKRHTMLLYVLSGLARRHRGGHDPRPDDRRDLDPRHAATNSTRSPPSSSVAPCSSVAAERSPAPCSAC